MSSLTAQVLDQFSTRAPPFRPSISPLDAADLARYAMMGAFRKIDPQWFTDWEPFPRFSFQEVRVVDSMRTVPRFGNTRDIVKMFGSSEEEEEYWKGVEATANFCWAVFALWYVRWVMEQE